LRKRIQAFKDERIGGRRKEFIETVVVESIGKEGDIGKEDGKEVNGDAMDLS
jgi:hypothetical protein